MEAQFNPESLFKKRPVVDVLEKEVFRKAALLYHCDLKSDFSEFSSEDVKLIQKRSYKRPDGLYRLRIQDRVKVLRDSIGVENLVSAIDEYKIKSEFTDVIKQIVTQKNIDYSLMSNAGLYYAGKLAELFPNRLDEERIGDLYQRRQLLKPFERLTRNFAGRTDELTELSDYVDWLPKSSISKQISSFFRNLIDWNEKPPLLLKGIGGIGKSTIVAKFIMEQNNERNGKQLPFVYIDFDLPGFSIREPMTILLEALRQIAAQYPTHKFLIESIRSHIEDMIYNEDEGREEIEQSKMQSITGTTGTSRGFVYSSVKELISSYEMELSNIGKTPILVVFDSFEEMQYRATSTEMHTFFSFVREISEQLPRIRPVFAGRAEISERIYNIKFKPVPIEDFDEISANALLEKWRIEDPEVRTFIYETFGGNPLMLRLATDLALKDGFDMNNMEEIQGQKWKYLVQRIRDHINDEDVRKLAVPGMMVRYVNADIIQKVLAVPTGIGIIDAQRAQKIYEELQKEVALISKTVHSDEFMFRQDLRMTCEDAILEKYPDACKDIRQRAINYYASYHEIEDPTTRAIHQAEYYYHQLKRGEIPKELTAEEYEFFRNYIEPAIIELPNEAKLFLSSLTSQNVAQETLDKATDEEWERYYSSLIWDAMNGELEQLWQLEKDIRPRRDRMVYGFPEYMLQEALLYQRLGNFEDSYRSLNYYALERPEVQFDPPLSKEEINLLRFGLNMLEAENLEYQERYSEALELLRPYYPIDMNMYRRVLLRYYLMFYRILSRIDIDKETDVLRSRVMDSIAQVIQTQKEKEDSFSGDTKARFIVEHFNPKYTHFRKHSDHNKRYRSLYNELRNLETLEGYCYRNYGLFIKDITYTAVFEIALRDVIWAGELIGRTLAQK